MKLQFTSTAYGTCCGEDLVLLDIASGSYSCLPGCAPLVRLDPGASSLDVLDQDLAQALLQVGMVREGAGEPRSAPGAPVRELRARAQTSLTPGHGTGMVRALAWMGRNYWRAPFGRVVGSARAGALGEAGDLGRITQLTLAFRQLLPWIPLQGVCLYRSALLLAFLRAHGVSARWVFGVQTYPFEAHCWLQAGDLVLDDHVEHVLSLVPILALDP